MNEELLAATKALCVAQKNLQEASAKLSDLNKQREELPGLIKKLKIDVANAQAKVEEVIAGLTLEEIQK